MFTENDKKMITPTGDIYRYIGSDIIDSFNVGDCADISFPNGYNKANRVFKGYCPCINTTTVKSFIVKTEEKMEKVICELRYDEGVRFFEDDTCGTLRTISECGNKHVIEADKIQNKGGRNRMINGKIRIRKLTPTECYKLMGFTAEDCKKASNAGISNSQLYKQAGNSIVVNVLEALFTSLGKNYDEFKSATQ